MSAVRDADEQRVRRATGRIGFWVAGSFTAVLAIGVAILVSVILSTSRLQDDAGSPRGRGPGRGGSDYDHLVVDVDRVLPWVIGLGVIGVVVMGVVAVIVARRAVRPLADALAVQRRFVADAGHELRTPLTALHARVQTAQRRQARGDDVTDTLVALRADADAMNAVLTDMLLVASPDPAAPGAGAVSPAVAEAVRLLRPLADEAHVVLAVHDMSEDAIVPLSPTALSRMVVALIDNAVQHAPAASTVVVSVHRAPHAVQVRVSDQGGGIGGIAPEDVFRRFARGGESGRRRGFGIGLALVKDLAARAGGDVVVERSGPDGTVFRLDLPLASRDER